VAQEHWQNDLYAQLAAGAASQTNPIAANLLEALEDSRYKSLRESVLDDLHLYPGAVALDLGCGPGMLLEGMADRVGEDGEIHGLDLNPHFVDIAQRRATMFGYSNATYVTADCHTLPYPDEMFDAVAAERLLMHVAPIERIISEIARVLTVGGRVVIEDYDPYSSFAAGPNPTITSRVLASAANVYASPLASREAPSICVKLGLYVEQVRGHLLVFEDPTAPAAKGIATVWAEHATIGRQVDPGTVQRWLRAVERAIAQKQFLIAIPHIITIATRVR
jgi:2-polyprenyl-3-methyl-5-hydroxy-6-metoxy-1,4-benzoquinol methylase